MNDNKINKYTINFTREDRIRMIRDKFIRMYIDKHLADNPVIKKSLEDKFQQLIDEHFDEKVAS